MDTLTVSLFYIMLPGVLMSLIYDKYTQHKRWDSFKYILMSIVFGILTYLCMQFIISLFQLISNVSDTKSIKWILLSIWSVNESGKVINVKPLETLFASILSVPLGLLAVFLNKKRTIHSFLLRKGISNKYGDDNVFIKSIEEITSQDDLSVYILLLDDNVMIHGNIYFYNESDKTQEIGLGDVTMFSMEDGKVTLMTGFLYISKEFGKMILFKNNLPIEEEGSEE